MAMPLCGAKLVSFAPSPEKAGKRLPRISQMWLNLLASTFQADAMTPFIFLIQKNVWRSCNTWVTLWLVVVITYQSDDKTYYSIALVFFIITIFSLFYFILFFTLLMRTCASLCGFRRADVRLLYAHAQKHKLACAYEWLHVWTQGSVCGVHSRMGVRARGEGKSDYVRLCQSQASVWPVCVCVCCALALLSMCVHVC